ncbi:MAG: hypothetical protein MHPSP_001155, partial [Paramarteilia canceri]
QSNILKKWYEENIYKPYASENDVEKLSKITGLEVKSIRKWLSNRRTRSFQTRKFYKTN